MPLPLDVSRCLHDDCPRASECARSVSFADQQATVSAVRQMCHVGIYESFIPCSSDAELEREVMIHRFLYYVLGKPATSDREYDKLEAYARSVLPATSPVHGVGSDSSSDYPAVVVVAARRLAERKE